MKYNDQPNIDPDERDEELGNVSKDEQQTCEDGDKMAEDTENENSSKGDTNGEQKELEELRRKYGELNNSYLRLHADFDNFRKRTLKEKTDLIKSGGERVLLDIITLVDDFDRALEALHKTEDREAMLEGMDLIYGKFIAFLKQHGVIEIEAVGQPFDAESFEAVTTTPAAEESQKGMVIDCIQKGYRLNDKIIRFPKVIVGE